MAVNLGELLLAEGLISAFQLRHALAHQKANGGTLAAALVALGVVKDEDITLAISRKCGIPSVDLDACVVEPAALMLVPADLARKYRVLPLSRGATTLVTAMVDPTDASVREAVRFLTGRDVEAVVASESAFARAIVRYYGSPPPQEAAPGSLPRREPAEEDPLERLSRKHGVPYIRLSRFTIDPATIKIIPADVARTLMVLPLCRSGGTLSVAMANPSDVGAVDEIRFLSGLNIEPIVVTEQDLRDALRHYYAPSMAPRQLRHELVRPEAAGTKRYACLFASWRDGSYWFGEVRGDRSRGLHVNWRAGRDKCETRARGDANDRAATLAEGVDFLMSLRAAEVESRYATDGPPLTLDAVFVESGDPLEMESLLKKRDRAWQRAGSRSEPAWLPWVMAPLALLAFAGLHGPSLGPLAWLTTLVGVASVGFASVKSLALLRSWQVNHLRHKAWRG